MSELKPPKDAELNRALLEDDFGSDVLAHAGAVFPKPQFLKAIFWKQPDILVIKDIVDWLDERGPPVVERLLQGAIFVKPKCPKVRTFCEQHYPKGLEPLAAEFASQVGNFGLIQDVKLGLQLLSDNSADQEVRSILAEFRVRLQETNQQIRLLKKYKGLHNCLHKLQGQLAGIEATIQLARISGNLKGLRKIALNLKPLAAEARNQTTDLVRPRREIEWIDEFDSYIGDMIGIASATAPTDLDRVSDIPNMLRALLRQQSPRINGLLVDAADNLKLGSLIETMTAIAKKIALKTAANDSILLQLSGGAEAVEKLQKRMMALVDQHYDWQDLNTALDEAELSEDHQPQIRMPKWGHFKKKLEGLCNQYPDEDWSENIMGLLSDWIRLAPSVSPEAAEKDDGDLAFDAFLRACVERFINVDTQLNELSDEVVEVAKPLDKLLSQIP